LAAPWNFHAGHAHPARLFDLITDFLPLLCDGQGTLPVDAIQSLFFMLDPLSAERKFTRFATLDPAGEEARGFVALEDWVNDGVPLARSVARDCALLVRRKRAGARPVANKRRSSRSEAAASACPRRGSGPRPDRPAEIGGGVGG